MFFRMPKSGTKKCLRSDKRKPCEEFFRESFGPFCGKIGGHPTLVEVLMRSISGMDVMRRM